jgi:hypothetical protein
MPADLLSKRKRTVNPKLLDDDNVSNDAIKRRKLEALKAKSVTQISAPQALSNVSHSNSSTSRHASVEAVDDNENIHLPNAGSPKNPNTIIESVADDDDDDIYGTDPRSTVRDTAKEAEKKKAETEEEPEETDEDELSKSATPHWESGICNLYPQTSAVAERLEVKSVCLLSILCRRCLR